MKRLSYKHIFLLFSFLVLAGCLSGKRPDVRLSPNLDKRLRQISPMPVAVGVYIDPMLRNYVQKEHLTHYNVGVHTFTFPIGESLFPKIEEMSLAVFERAMVVDRIENDQNNLDGFLTVALKKSDITLTIEESVWRAIGQHKLSITASFFGQKLNKIWESEVTVEGKGFDFISSRIEYEWWRESGPNFAPAVDDAIQKVTYELAQRLITSKEITEFASTVAGRHPK